MDQLKATEESGYDSGTGVPDGTGGNPTLDPWRAYAFDVSYEKYFAERGGYVSVAGFYKDFGATSSVRPIPTTTTRIYWP